MLKSNHARTGGLAVRILGSLAVLVGLGAIMALTLPKDESSGTGTETNVFVEDSKSRRCEDQLADIFEALTPGRLGISSDRRSLIDRLNAWHQECGGLVGDDVQPTHDKDLIQSLLSGEALARTLSERYLAEDASHVRMCLLARDIVTSVVEGDASNVSRAVSLFEFVNRNVMLINDEIRKTLPMTQYEALIFGLGTAEDRAWIFADLLRQIRVDAVIITPRNKEHADHWLVGVVEPELGVLLFDARLGLPIPAPDCPTDTPFPELPATLNQVRESDDCLRKLDLPNSPYPLTSADLQDVDVELIGSSSSWAPRMALLQFLLPAGVSVDLYDGLGPNELRIPGAVDRIVVAGEGGLWNRDQVSIWKYPETQETVFESTRGEGEPGSQLAGFNLVFRGPYVPRATDAEGKEIQNTPIHKSLHYVRIEQLKGKFSDAIRDYLPVRTTVNLVKNNPNLSAAELGTLWTGVCQYETRKIPTALGTLDRFIRDPSYSIGRKRTAMEFVADCLLTQKKYEQAARVLLNLPPGFAPRRDIYLARRWLTMAGLDPDEVLKPKDEQAQEMPSRNGISSGEPDEAPARAPDAPPASESEAPAKQTQEMSEDPPARAPDAPPEPQAEAN